MAAESPLAFHHRSEAVLPVEPERLFTHLDDHRRLSSHMEKPSLMTAGASMRIDTDADHGQAVGSVIRMSGRVLGVRLGLEEVVTEHAPPQRKVWETVGEPTLYHDRGDGGLFATVCEMAFAAHCGVSLMIDTVCYDPKMNDVDGLDRRPDSLKGRFNDRIFGSLFNEELGAVIQIRREDRERVSAIVRAAGLGHCLHSIGHPNEHDEIRVWRNAKMVYGARRSLLWQTWSETSHRIARLRDDAASCDEAFAALADESDPGLSPSQSFDPSEDVAAPFVNTGAKPKIAILREQGVNGQVEMAAAFARAGFESYDVHMSDLQQGRHRLADFHGFALSFATR